MNIYNKYTHSINPIYSVAVHFQYDYQVNYINKWAVHFPRRLVLPLMLLSNDLNYNLLQSFANLYLKTLLKAIKIKRQKIPNGQIAVVVVVVYKPFQISYDSF